MSSQDWRLATDESVREERVQELARGAETSRRFTKGPMSDEERAERKELAIDSYSQWGNIGEACRNAGISRDSWCDWLAKDVEFKRRIDQAKQDAVDRLEKELHRRAIEGREEPVFHKGELVGLVKKPSDLLGIFIMKGERPEKYRERFEHSGPGGGPIQTQVSEVRVRIVDPSEEKTT